MLRRVDNTRRNSVKEPGEPTLGRPRGRSQNINKRNVRKRTGSRLLLMLGFGSRDAAAMGSEMGGAGILKKQKSNWKKTEIHDVSLYQKW
jgi:hypothetical protein